jgi:hypothetical protein
MSISFQKEKKMAVATLENVAKLYVATFNRAPLQAGLEYWVNTSGLAPHQKVRGRPDRQVLLML